MVTTGISDTDPVVPGVAMPETKSITGVVPPVLVILPAVPLTEVTVPPEPVADNVPPEKATPVPIVTLEKPPKLSPYNIEVPLVAGA